MSEKPTTDELRRVMSELGRRSQAAPDARERMRKANKARRKKAAERRAEKATEKK